MAPSLVLSEYLGTVAQTDEKQLPFVQSKDMLFNITESEWDKNNTI